MSSPAGPPSPCINLCKLDARGYCVGCLRTGAEIAAWPRANTEVKLQILAALDLRHRHRAEVLAKNIVT